MLIPSCLGAAVEVTQALCLNLAKLDLRVTLEAFGVLGMYVCDGVSHTVPVYEGYSSTAVAQVSTVESMVAVVRRGA